jgi:hypothetical protein
LGSTHKLTHILSTLKPWCDQLDSGQQPGAKPHWAQFHYALEGVPGTWAQTSAHSCKVLASIKKAPVLLGLSARGQGGIRVFSSPNTRDCFASIFP